jgi:hypothetical protein
MAFQNIKAGDRVRFAIRAPTGPILSHITAKVNPLLIFDHHVVVNHGNNGTVVDSRNFLCIIKTHRSKTP